MKIAVYGIMKNEAKHVAGYIKTASEADCIVMCDTGSEDISWRDAITNAIPLAGTAIIHVHEVNIMPFRFDTARNVALALVPSDVDVCVSLDLDERLRPGWREILERAWADEVKPTRLWCHYKTPGLTPFYHNDRIHARKGYRWTDPCHECIKAWGINEVQAVAERFWIDHEQDRAKPRSYLPLLALGVDEEPWNRRRIFFYGRELMCQFKFQPALDWLCKYMDIWKVTGEPMWEEPRQAEAMIALCRGCLKELAEGKTLPELDTLKTMDKDGLGIIDKVEKTNE